MFKKIVVFTSGCCLLALGVLLLQACFFPFGGTGGASGTTISGLWEGTMTIDIGSGEYERSLKLVLATPTGGGITGSAGIGFILGEPRVIPILGTRLSEAITLESILLGSFIRFSGTVTDNIISGTIEFRSKITPWQVTRTYPYYAVGGT